MSTVCSHCGGTDIEYDQARGDAVCTSCGSVLEDNIIVSEVSFQEQSSGASTVVGQFVSAESGKAPLSGTGFHHGMAKDSREITLQQAKKRLTHLGNMLKLNQHHIDSAFMFFKMALQLNLTRGRKSSIIDTACLYLVCRSEGTPHLLLDFSDVLQINVYALGRAYLKLSNALHINPPAIDPCLYIHRFAHKLELGEKTRDVAMTAMRLVCRMKRDWIHHGRRPAGLCGAALLVASRLHNFNRTVREVAKVVKLSDGTVRKRLGDFKDTPSSRLTIEEFLKIDLEQEHDPPSFTEAKKKTKQHQTQVTLEDDDESATEGDGREHPLKSPTASGKATGVLEEEEMEVGGRGYGGIMMSSVEDIIAKARLAESFMNTSTAGLGNDLDDLARLVSDEEEENASSPAQDQPNPDELDLEGIDDEEIDKLLLSEEEVKIKTQLWFAENADYLKEQEERKERLAALKAAKGDKPKKKYNKRRQRTQHAPASSAGEAIERMLVEKKISSKLNYDVLKDLDAGFLADGGPVGPAFPNIDSTQPFGGLGSAEPSSSGLAGMTSVPDRTDQLTPSPLPLEVDRSPLSGSGRLPSLQMRKRASSSLGEGSISGAIPKVSRIQQPLDRLSVHRPPPATQLNRTHQIPAPDISNSSSGRSTWQEPDVTLHGITKPTPDVAMDSTGPTPSIPGVGTESTGPEVVEESGPVAYSEGEEEEEEGENEEEGLDDVEMDELVYEGDPLLDSDYEDGK